MRDELERLLQAEEEETEQVAEVLQFRATAYSTEPKGRSGTENLLEGQTDFPAKANGDFPEDRIKFFAGAEEKLPGIIRERFAWLNEESFRRENAGQFYEALSRTKRMARTAVRPTEKVRTPMVRQETDQTRPGQDARWLDRIFQRDARRYDGGFTWQ